MAAPHFWRTLVYTWGSTQRLVSCLTVVSLCYLVYPGDAQLENARVGLPDNGDGPVLNTQNGYPTVPYDIPFGERYQVRLKYYNVSTQPRYYLKKPPAKVACCYNFNAYWTANAALHPYWFRVFGLDRWCRQDVCLSIWLPDRSHDLMFKVTDVCDPKDCPTPLHVKVEPYKGRYLFHVAGSDPSLLPQEPVHMYFCKCWADGMPQPEMVDQLPGPTLINSRHWMIKATQDQWNMNQAWNRQNKREPKALGMLWRPWATMKTLKGYRAQDYPPGSSNMVRRKYSKKC